VNPTTIRQKWRPTHVAGDDCRASPHLEAEKAAQQQMGLNAAMACKNAPASVAFAIVPPLVAAAVAIAALGGRGEQRQGDRNHAKREGLARLVCFSAPATKARIAPATVFVPVTAVCLTASSLQLQILRHGLDGLVLAINKTSGSR